MMIIIYDEHWEPIRGVARICVVLALYLLVSEFCICMLRLKAKNDNGGDQ